jgi:cardiolipin synthase
MLWTVVSILEIAYVVVLSIWILLEKRSPVATLAWILALGALPVVGFVLFFFLGPRRLRRKRSRRLTSRSMVRAQVDITALSREREPLALESEQLMKLAYRTGEAPPATCRSLTLLTNPDNCYTEICAAIDAAKHHVHVEYYIFEPGDAATKIRDALVRARARGVEVRLLVDAVGSSAMGRTFLAPLLEKGGHYATFNPVFFARLQAPINFRNHRKIVVCDGRVGFTGGINVCDDYLSGRGQPPWRDTHLRLEGNAVRWLALAFFDDWIFATGELPEGAAYFPDQELDEPLVAQVVASGPDHDFESIRNTYFAAIANARDRVWITTPYFVPDEAILTALTTAALRGVDVRILVPRRGDSLVVTLAARSYYEDLLHAGARVYEYMPAMLHAKTMLVDRDLSIIGTANLDNRSFRLNFEVCVCTFGDAMNSELARVFEEDLTQAEQVKRSRRARLPWHQRLGEAGSRLLSPIL